uniref:Uncharacterized protein n=1 Tax=Nomascus leucogenys TaxID=61853 RepID=A0A2I3GWC0_NOMLE
MRRGRGWAMRRAAAGAGGARAARPTRGASRLHPNAGRRSGARAGAQGCGGPRAGSRALPAQPSACARGRSQRLVGDPKAASALPDLALDVFVLRVWLEEMGEMFRVANCRGDMTLRELKEELDLMVGIPFKLQRLQYLDEGGSCPDSFPGHMCEPSGPDNFCIFCRDGFLPCCPGQLLGDPSKVFSYSSYRTANSEHFESEKWKQWMSQRAFVALYVASHRGHFDAVQYLLEHGASCLSRSPLAKSGIRDLNDLVMKNTLQRVKSGFRSEKMMMTPH